MFRDLLVLIGLAQATAFHWENYVEWQPLRRGGRVWSLLMLTGLGGIMLNDMSFRHGWRVRCSLVPIELALNEDFPLREMRRMGHVS
jgi:hypothetical protein